MNLHVSVLGFFLASFGVGRCMLLLESKCHYIASSHILLIFPVSNMSHVHTAEFIF